MPILNRKCTTDYQIPGTDVILEKDTAIIVPVLALHMDPEYYPDPEKFDPERFNEENKKNIHPFTYLPFGEGPRICIGKQSDCKNQNNAGFKLFFSGLRFGLMQTKVGLTVLLKNYLFTLNSKTQIPLKMDPFSFVMSPLGGVWLDVQRINK